MIALNCVEFCKLARGIWQNFPWKTIGPTYLLSGIHQLSDMLGL